MEEGFKFKIWALDPDHTHFGGISSRIEMGLTRSIHIQNLKLLAASYVSYLDKEF